MSYKQKGEVLVTERAVSLCGNGTMEHNMLHLSIGVWEDAQGCEAGSPQLSISMSLKYNLQAGGRQWVSLSTDKHRKYQLGTV